MGLDTPDLDDDVVLACHERSFSGGELAGAKPGRSVERENGIGLRDIEKALFQHGFGSALLAREGGFFGRLEDKHDGAAKLAPNAGKGLGGAHEYGGVRVVAAGVHHPHLFTMALLSAAKACEDAISDGSEVFFAPMDVVLAEATAVQPDLVLVLENNASILKDVVRGVPNLVVEVLSPSTMQVDRGLKMETYARYGIEEYWIVDIERSSIEIFRLDRGAEAYRLIETCREADQAATPLLPGLSLQASKLFSK